MLRRTDQTRIPSQKSSARQPYQTIRPARSPTSNPSRPRTPPGTTGLDRSARSPPLQEHRRPTPQPPIPSCRDPPQRSCSRRPPWLSVSRRLLDLAAALRSTGRRMSHHEPTSPLVDGTRTRNARRKSFVDGTDRARRIVTLPERATRHSTCPASNAARLSPIQEPIAAGTTATIMSARRPDRVGRVPFFRTLLSRFNSQNRADVV